MDNTIEVHNEPPVELSTSRKGSKYDPYIETVRKLVENNRLEDGEFYLGEETLTEGEVSSLRTALYNNINRDEHGYKLRSGKTEDDPDQYCVWIERDR